MAAFSFLFLQIERSIEPEYGEFRQQDIGEIIFQQIKRIEQ